MFPPRNKNREIIARCVIALCVATLVAFSASAKDRPKKEKNRPLDTADVARAIVVETNEFRQQSGQAGVARNDRLTEAALEFAQFLSQSDQFSHTADGRRPDERAQQHRYDYCVVLENIAYRFDSAGYKAAQLAHEFVLGWENSPGHRKNMLSADVTETGVAVVFNKKNDHYYAVQMFGRPKSDAIEFDVENHADVNVAYTLGGKPFALDPGEARTHRLCGSPKLELQRAVNKDAIVPQDRNRYTVNQDASGKLRLQRE